LTVEALCAKLLSMVSVDRPGTAAFPGRRRASGATRSAILLAARQRLLADGIAGMSTRGVAEAAGVPLSQLHYYFGSKQQLILDLLEEENTRRLARQTQMYAEDRPLWQRYEQACDFLEDDLESGYVRVLHEMIAAGWSDPAIGARVRELLQGWVDLIAGVSREAEGRFGPVGPFPVDEIAALIAQAFLGGEAMLLLGFDRRHWPVRSALRRFALLIRGLEEGASTAVEVDGMAISSQPSSQLKARRPGGFK
jgi:AcrR family transcriptional regulator